MDRAKWWVLILAAGLSGAGARDGAAAWPPEGVPLSSASLNASVYMKAASDGAGGAIVVLHVDNQFFYAQRIDSTGATSWGPSGVFLGNSTVLFSDVVSDGAGGAFIAWSSGNVRVQHLDAAGTALWGPVTVYPSADGQSQPLLTADGSGGVIVAWSDGRSVTPGPGLYTQRLNASGAPMWPASGVHCGASASHTALVADGLGGAYVAWTQVLSGQTLVRVSRVHAGASAWSLILATGSSASPTAVSDGANGVIVAWSNLARRLNPLGGDVWGPGVVIVASSWSTSVMVSDGAGGAIAATGGGRAMRIGGSGAPLWSPSTGVAAFGNRAVNASFPLLVSDGSGGCVFVVEPTPNSGAFLYAQRLSSSGASEWPVRGVPVIVNYSRSLTPVGDGGAMVFYADGTPRAMRLLPRGCTPPFLPSVQGVEDVPNDQGGWIRVPVQAAGADVPGQEISVAGYGVWREIPEAAPARPFAVLDASGQDAAARSRAIEAVAGARFAGVTLGRAQAAAVGFPPGSWESAGYVPAAQRSSYQLLSPTRDDGVDEIYIVTTHSNQPDYYTVAGPTTGHSIDNLPPAMPQNLIGLLEPTETAHLTWSASHESDFSRYSVHRGDEASFVPGAGNRLGSPNTPEWIDAAYTPQSYYKVSAIDRHGNESPFAEIAPNQITGVAGVVPGVSFLAAPVPNPARGGAAIDFGTSRAGRATLEVFSLDGGRVRTLIAAVVPAGTHHARWNLANESGANVRAGVYLVRMTAVGTLATRRLVVLE